MLCLVGLGVWDERDISLRGMETCRNADKIYCELYTACWGGDLEKLEKLAGKGITRLERKDVEEGAEGLLKEAGEKRIVLLVPGDPLTATTHIHIILEAKKRGIPFEVVHSSSVYTSAARTGLQIYKFGRTGTVITPERGYESEGFYRVVEENLEHGLHTLLLLDRDMPAKEGLEILKGLEGEKGGKILNRVVICSRLSSEEEKIVYGEPDDLMKADLPPPAVIIIPGKLHFLEEEFLETLK